ncbi:MAG: NACHT domain protein [Candidatus Parabeggiatoa sp. nov. 1]|nr:MAG: NACHT domain protein [Gammaproteobacteria bacterium]
MIFKTFPKIVVLILLGSLCLTGPTWAQSPSPRDALMVEIQKRAQRDVEHHKPQKTLHELDLLFGEKAKVQGVSISQIEEWYEEAYQSVKPEKSWLAEFMENQVAVLGWGLAILFLIFHFLREAMNKFVIHVFTTTKNWLYRRLAGYRFLHKIALRRYRQALIDKFRQFIIPFRPGRPLNMGEIYVPLKVKGTRDIDQIDAYQALTKHKRLMVVGAPGAGKSMLLRHIALSYAEGRLTDLPKLPVPILLELNRLNESDAPIKEKLVKILDLHDFPNAHNFVEIGLKSGTVMLLFDGLDEVNTSERQRVVNKINELLDKYPRCSAVITCRVAVYHNEFAEKTDQTLEIVDFNDQQIWAFLAPWQKDMPDGKSIEQLIRTLRERPRIMALARNSLLLTIIAYLYTDTDFVLPHSRAEFYSKATDVLLDQWKVERNHYKAVHKRMVLRHLALFNQDSGAKRKQDRRSIERENVLEQIKLILPDFNLADEDVEPILDDIVERSGLLLSIDGGERYQFAYLTLQEFFAAAALRDDAEQLLTRFKADQDTWRETVKIWCGLDHDSTELIRAIYAEEPIMAFECVADAQQVSTDLADEIMEYFKSQLGTADKKGEVINRAFAAIASDIRPRGQNVFGFLADTLADTEESEQRRVAAAKTLSMSNLSQAAEVLVRYRKIPEVRSALRRMGDLAVPVLETLAKTRG